jgi:hypothetical protein
MDPNQPQPQAQAQQAPDPVVQQQIQQLNQQLQAAMAQIAILQAPAQPVPQVAPVVPVVRFAYSPAATNANALIDYTTTAGMKMYKQATEGLAAKHDLDAEHLNRFLESLRSRAIEQAWEDGILQITQHGQRLSLIEHYGTITQQSVRAHAHTYAFQNQRSAQDANNLFKCLESSLADDALNTLYAEKEIYTLRRGDVALAPAGNAHELIRDGVLFLWSIINHTIARTNATISVIIEQLTNLPSLMTEVNSDVNAFNTNVRSLVNSYYSNKQETYDNEVLLQSLFRAYKQCSDPHFVNYMERKEEAHEDGSAILTANGLLEIALKQYQTRVQKKIWGQDSQEHKEIINLTVQLQKSQDDFNKFKLTFDKNDKKKDDNKSGKKGKGKKDKREKGGKKKEFLPYEEYRKQRYNESPKWMKEKPTDLKQEKAIKGKTYFWCEKHKLWQQHKTSDCRIGANKTTQQDDAKAKVDEKGKVQFQVTPHTTMVMPDDWQNDY